MFRKILFIPRVGDARRSVFPRNAPSGRGVRYQAHFLVMTRMTRIKTLLAMLLVSAALPAVATAGAGLPDKVREANARFKDVKQAVKEGYSPIPCTSGVDGGAMGIHYVNADLIKDEAIDLSRPEAVMYEPDARGRME